MLVALVLGLILGKPEPAPSSTPSTFTGSADASTGLTLELADSRLLAVLMRSPGSKSHAMWECERQDRYWSTAVSDSQLNPLSAVPGPIAGAGIPGLITACLGMFGLNWRRRRKNLGLA